MPEVRCTVNDCTYWDEGNKCAAERIWVTLDQMANRHDMEVADLEDVQTEARRSEKTCCHTYEPNTKRK